MNMINVVIVGGGMITHDQLLPALYHLRRLGHVGRIAVVGRRHQPLRELADAADLREAFPDQSFEAHPASDHDGVDPDRYRRVIEKLPPRQLAVVATPDPLHYQMVRFCLERNQHVIVVKPLVLRAKEALDLEQFARERGLFVGVEYHKRFDRRTLEARRSYRAGRFGEFRCGEAKLIEPWNYRYSNFQTWFTCENTDPFTYIGCHYVDMVYFITGLRPAEVAVRGVRGRFPNGNEGFLWSAGQVVFENGAVLSVVNGLGYPDQGAGSNDQGLVMFCENGSVGGVISHNDQFRGVSHCYADGRQPWPFRFINPDYLRLVQWTGEGLKPVGYGYDSVEANVLAALEVNATGESLAGRQAALRRIDEKGLIATPANSFINDLVTEAGRMSILSDGRRVRLDYQAMTVAHH